MPEGLVEVLSLKSGIRGGSPLRGRMLGRSIGGGSRGGSRGSSRDSGRPPSGGGGMGSRVMSRDTLKSGFSSITGTTATGVVSAVGGGEGAGGGLNGIPRMKIDFEDKAGMALRGGERGMDFTATSGECSTTA